jgi:hypothetical protein
MEANQIPPSEPEETAQQPEPLPWGQNLLGIEILSDDFYEDIPLEFFLGDEESNKFFHLDEIADQQDKGPHILWPNEEGGDGKHTSKSLRDQDTLVQPG